MTKYGKTLGRNYVIGFNGLNLYFDQYLDFIRAEGSWFPFKNDKIVENLLKDVDILSILNNIINKEKAYGHIYKKDTEYIVTPWDHTGPSKCFSTLLGAQMYLIRTSLHNEAEEEKERYASPINEIREWVV